MSTPKMLVVILKNTKAVLAAVSRKASGVPPLADVVGDGLIIRVADSEASITVPVTELDVKEVDASEDPFVTPRTQALSDDGALVGVLAPDVSFPGPNARITIPTTPAVPADKKAVIVVHTGPNTPARSFSGTTGGGGSGNIDIPVSGIPAGAHIVVASVAGYGSVVKSLTF